MSAGDEAADDMMCCASCGQAEVDEIKLMDCDGGCDLVRYCSVECQENHKEQHEEECKKRLAELRDRDLFTQPDESHLGECPICCLPLPITVSNMFMPCCSKRICMGCNYANHKREFEAGLYHRCAFCREPMPKSQEKVRKNIMKRIKENNDPDAMCHMGKQHYREGSYETALEYLTKASELGDAEAHYMLSCMYHEGEGVEKDMKKAVYHLEEAAIGGHAKARYNVGIHEVENGRFERARRHFIIAANLGCHDSLKVLMTFHANGLASKEDYASALRAYQAAVDETKSKEREIAEKSMKNGEVSIEF